MENVRMCLHGDWNGKIVFSSYEPKPLDYKLPKWLDNGDELPRDEEMGSPLVERYCDSNGILAVSIYSRIPTFDSSDRIYDSWRKLYLFRGKKKGTVDGLYMGGGYKLSFVEMCNELTTAPPKFLSLLEKYEIIKT